MFGSTNATSSMVSSETFLGESVIMASSPAGAGAVDVTVVTPEGTRPIVLADRFSYLHTARIGTMHTRGQYATAKCRSVGGVTKYGWTPPFGQNPLVKSHFTTTLTSGATTLESVKGSKVTCAAETGSGNYTGPKTVGGMVLTFTGCERSGEKCTSGVASEKSHRTRSKACWASRSSARAASKNKIGLDLFPVGKTGVLMEFACGRPPCPYGAR